jgi:glycosyltransferase involved in cell wall biosynthesis
MKRKNVLLVLSSYITLIKFRLPLVLELNDDYCVTIILPLKDKSLVDENIIPLNVNLRYANLDRSSASLVSIVSAFLSILRAIKVSKPDLIIAFTMKPIVMVGFSKYLINFKFIPMLTGLGEIFIGNPNAKSKIFSFFLKYILNNADSVWVTNKIDEKFARSLIGSRLIAVKNVSGCGVDFEMFKTQRKDNLLSREIIRVGFFARVIKSKGILEFVDSAKRLHEMRLNKSISFHIYGFLDEDSKSFIDLKDLSLDSEEYKIFYEGMSDDVPNDMDKMDIICLPSYREGLPTTLVEAAALKKIIITTDVPGCNEVVDHGKTGFLASVRSVDSLTKTFLKVLELNSEEVKEIGTNARSVAIKKYSREVIIDNQCKLILEVLNNEN